MLKSSDIPSSFYLLSGRIVIGFGQLLMIRVLTSILDSVEIGKYYLLMSVVSGVSFFLINPVTVYIQRHLYGWNEKGVARIAIRKLLIFLPVTVIGTSGILYCLNNLTLINLDVSLIFLVIIIPLLIAVLALTGLLPDLCNLLGKYRAFVLLSNLDLWGKIGFICLFASIFPHLVGTVLLAMVCWGGLSALMSGSYLYRLLKKPQDDDDPFNLKRAKDIFLFSWPLTLAAGLYWGQSEGYRFILQNTAGVDIMGKFVVAYSLGATLMIAIDTIFHQVYLPTFYKEISAETVKSHIVAWNKYAKKIVGVFIPVGVYVACAGPFLAHWLVHPSYRDIGIYAAFGAISQLFRIFSGCSYFGIAALKNTSLLILPGVLGTTIALAGTFVLSSKFPILGTGISLIFSHLIVCVGTYLQLKRKIAVQLPWLRIGKAILLSLPFSFILLIAYKLGWDVMHINNLILLALTGLGMLYIQWRLAKDVWFQRESKVDIVKVS
jgi:O-antigen/teichoic acid export membrane protein